MKKTLEQLLEEARETVGKFTHIDLIITHLTLFDLGLGPTGGYVATFQFTESLQSDEDYEKFFALADTFPQTGKAPTAREAIQKALDKCETELAEYVRKNFKYSDPFKKESARVSI